MRHYHRIVACQIAVSPTLSRCLAVARFSSFSPGFVHRPLFQFVCLLVLFMAIIWMNREMATKDTRMNENEMQMHTPAHRTRLTVL
jgi:hypothetical protein